MICPECRSEYREGFTICADCQVALIHALPEVASEAGETESDSPAQHDGRLSIFWKGEDARIHAEICQILLDHEIPYKSVRREDHLFNFRAKSAFQIGIPAEMFDRAEAALQDAYSGVGEGSRNTDGYPALLEIAVEEEHVSDWDPLNWFPEDATSQVWSSEDGSLGEMLVASLRENKIHAKLVGEDKTRNLYVLPGDEPRAREIVREVLDAISKDP